MQITVFGANGRVGKLVVAEALKKGHKVTAFVYGDNPFKENLNLKIIHGDIYNFKDVKDSLVGSDSVISALGSWGTPKKDILSAGMNNIVAAMKELKINRIVSLTGAGCREYQANTSLLEKLSRIPLILLAPKIVKDAESHIKILYESNLDWTVVRSPVMNNWGNPNNYKLEKSCPMPWSTINRQSVALSLIELVLKNKSEIRCPYIRRK
jgi:putative NADH-flavin reductase